MISGQLTIFDTYTDNKPCRYKFKRYIGQKVRVMIGPWQDQNFKTGTITKNRAILHKGEMRAEGILRNAIQSDGGEG